MGLAELRSEIDRIDGEIVSLLNERVRKAVLIGEEKKRDGAPVQDPVRETEVMDRVKELNKGPLSDDALEGLYRRIIDVCLAFQRDTERE